MAIIKCPECGKEISSSAPVCPNCGYSFMFAPPTQARSRLNLILLIVGAVFYFLTSKWYLAVVIAGVVIELIVTVVTVLAALLFGNRSVRIILHFLVFDLGFVIGTLIGLITGH